MEDNDPEPVAKTPIEIGTCVHAPELHVPVQPPTHRHGTPCAAADAMSVISDVRSKANNRSRHQAEFAAPPGVDPNGAKVFRR